MASKKNPRLTSEIGRRILASIRAGAEPSAAAQAWDVPGEVFTDWIQRGQKQKARPPYSTFAREVHQARAQARLRAELAVLEKSPLTWLERGPDRDQTDPAQINPLMIPGLLEIIQELMDALLAFPEARIHAAEKLSKRGLWKKKSPDFGTTVREVGDYQI